MSVTIRGTSSAGANATTATSSLAITKPTGTVSGDLLLLNADWQSSTPTITIPTGWTQLLSADQGNTNNVSVLLARVADGTATDSPTINLSATANLTLVMIGLGGWNGVALTSLVVANVHTATAATTVSFPAITPTTASDLLVYTGGLRPTATAAKPTFSTSPAGGTGGTVTKQQDISTSRTGSNVDSEAAIFTQQLTAATAVSAGTATVSTSSQANEYAIIVSPPSGTSANVTGVAANVTVAAGTGTLEGDANVTGLAAQVTVAAGTGTPAGTSPNANVTGVAAQVTVAAGVGTVAGSASVSGAGAQVAVNGGVGAPAGTANVTGLAGQVTVSGGSGTLSGSASITGLAANVTVAAGTGTPAGNANVTGLAAQVTVAGGIGTPAGTGGGGANVTGVAAQVTVTGGAGILSASANVTGVAAQVSVAGGAGTPVGTANATGLAAQVTITGGAGIPSGSANVTGAAAPVLVTAGIGALAASANVQGTAALITVLGGIGTPAGTGAGDVNVNGVAASVTVTAGIGLPDGTAGPVPLGFAYVGPVIGQNRDIYVSNSNQIAYQVFLKEAASAAERGATPDVIAYWTELAGEAQEGALYGSQ